MASSNRPGVEITQELSQSASIVAAPTLNACVVGVCYQIVEATDSDGALDSDAKYADGQYNQSSMYIPQASFPDPRDNIDELEVNEGSVEVSLSFGGSLRTLDRGSNDTYGSALLKLMNLSRKAAFRTSAASPYTFDSTTGDPLTLAFDVANSEDTSADVTVMLVGSMTATEVANEINEAVGSAVATVVSVSGNDKVQVASPTFGARSSVTVRAGTSALQVLFGGSFDDSLEYRVDGSGFCGQDDEDSDLVTPWLEFYRGDYFEDGTAQSSFPSSPTANKLWAGQVDLDGTFNTTKAAAVTYTGTSATVPLSAATTSKPGDTFWADGTRVGSGEIIKVEQRRFKVGKLNNTLSTFDDNGEPTNRVYDTVEVNTLYHSTPFAPKYSYFVAQGLTYGSITPAGEAASLTGTEPGLDARAAVVQGDDDVSFPINLASLTLNFSVTEDGVEGDEVTYTFVGGPFADVSDLVDALSAADELSQLTVSNDGDRLVLSTTKTGADQALSIKSTGTANTALQFSTSDVTEDTGKDVEFAGQASLTSDTFALPMTDVSKTFELVVEDSKGTHTLSASINLSTGATTLGGLLEKIAEAFGDPDGSTSPTLYDGAVAVATLSSSDDADTTGTITVTTVEGGTSVSLALTAVDETDGWRFLGFHDATGGTPAQLDSDGGITNFVDLAGLWVIGSTTGFRLTITGGSNALAATDLTIPASTYDADQLATAIQTAINAAIGSGTVTVVWNDAGYFIITASGASAITVAARSAGTSVHSEIFGGTTDQDAVATTWTGATPTQPRLTITATHTYNGTPTSITGLATYAMAAAASPAALAELLNASAAHNGVTAGGQRLVEWFSEDNDVLSVRTIKGGTLMTLAYAAAQPGFVALGFDSGGGTDTGAAAGGNADDEGEDGLKGSTLSFYLDDNPFAYEITFDSNSLQDAIDGINALVDGSDDVATEDDQAIVLSSLLVGAASKVEVDADSTADTVLGLTGTATGSGRPNPDFYLDADGAVHVGPNILRNRSSGIPFSLESAYADVYVSYTALRKDVTASAASPSLLDFENSEDMEAAIGPVRVENPLALGMFLALANAPSVTVSGLGVDEATAAAPEGTLDGWVRALKFLESREVYGIAPLTSDEYVQGLIATHVVTMSEPEERGERIVFLWAPIPSRAVATTIATGSDGETNGTENSFTLDVNPASSLIENDIDPSDEIDVDAGLYLELVVTLSGASELRRYSVSDVNGVILTLRTNFADDENVDGFFTTETLDEDLSSTDWSLKIRGEELVIAGTSLPDLGARASAAAEAAEAYASRRIYFLACNSLDTSIDGSTKNVEGYYAAAALAGMVSQQLPQQPFTNFPIGGFSRVYGTDDTFSERQMDTVADGGRMVLVNLGSAVVPRKQLSTSTVSVEYKELSITKAIDWVAKGLRSTNRVFIGRSVITSGFLDLLTLSNEGFLDYAEQLGVVRKAALSSLLQSTSEPDTVLVEVEVEPVYPCNKIKITIVS